LDGKVVAKTIRKELAGRVDEFIKSSGIKPTLATILVGNDPSSAVYVKMKKNACLKAGMESLSIHMSENTTTDQLIEKITALNNNPRVHGILLQHPVPDQIDERRCFDHIDVNKDVDGVTTHGFGKMSMGEPAYGSATPSGIMTLLNHYKIQLKGLHAVVVGRSPILGKPMAMMMLNQHATVTICHSRTINLPHMVGLGDVVVGAVGKPLFIQADWIKEGAVLIDAGYHPEGVGDIDLEKAKTKSSAYTPVPGGVGPMTIATLLTQTFQAAQKHV